MQPAYKLCPKCQQPAVLDQPACGRCGHQYRTRFTPGANQTQVIAPQMAAPSPAPPATAVADPHLILEECASQYRRLTWLWISAILSVPVVVGFLAVLPLHLAEMRLRDRVVSLGVNPELWERPLRAWRWRVFFYMFFAAFVIGILTYSLVTQQQNERERLRQEQLRGYGLRNGIG